MSQAVQQFIVTPQSDLKRNTVSVHVALFNADGSVWSPTDDAANDTIVKLEDRLAVLEDRIAALEAAAEPVEDASKATTKPSSKATPKTH